MLTEHEVLPRVIAQEEPRTLTAQSRYELRVIQQPEFAAETLVGPYGLPIVPAPMVEVIRLIDGREVDLAPEEAMRLVLTPHVMRGGFDNEPLEDVTEQGLRFEPTNVILDGNHWLFVFGDCGIRNVGRYSLRFSLWPMENGAPALAQVTTQTFPVVETGEWPLHERWFTPLSARIAEEHPRLHIYRPRF
ncbi:hypothetical protein PtA15_2A553 [Puccinia triticina]|nr:uncharacterized protein PtA15_2A553 [Puccinia triticina]WAQ82236.1 hypothetical protein PtA15_2A553 [Puccinia triticina]